MASIQAFASQGIKALIAKDAKGRILSQQGRRGRTIQINCRYKTVFSFMPFEARNNKKARSELFGDSIMKGASDEETFGTNFFGDNSGNWCLFRSCPWHKNTSPDVRANL